MNLEPHHLQEWLNSGVDEELILLNVRSLQGDEIYEYLLYALPQTARRNDGRLRDGYLRLYAHITNAWWVSGLDPLNGLAADGLGTGKARLSAHGVGTTEQGEGCSRGSRGRI